MKLGIEWNGIVHFKPIWGLEKLKRIQKTDKMKKKLCQQHGINLIVIPDLVSSDKYIREAFFKIVKILRKHYGVE